MIIPKEPVWEIMNLGITVIRSRRSIRSFKETPIPKDAISDALECARQAPTARNLQPWLFGTVTDRKMIKRIADATDSGKFLAGAPACFAIFTERDQKYYLEDGCAATMQLILGLQAYGVGSCWIAGDKKAHAEEIRAMLNVPEKYTLVSLVAAGYPGDISGEQIVVKKKDIKDITFSERFEPR
jgi:nitroreductase